MIDLIKFLIIRYSIGYENVHLLKWLVWNQF